MELTKSKSTAGEVVDGGKFCADCGGRCCKGCAEATAYFYQQMHATDYQRFSLAELVLINEIHNSGACSFHQSSPPSHPIYKLAELFGVEYHPKHGFGGPKGCRLPREKRSRTCLRYFCPELGAHNGVNYLRVNWNGVTKEEETADMAIFGKSIFTVDDPIGEYIKTFKMKKAA